MTLKDALNTLPQYLLPHHALSRAMSLLTHCRNKRWKNLLIKTVVRHYRVDMNEPLATDIDAYVSFNDFFTRRLRPELRSIAATATAIACPADGTVSQAGRITAGKIFQAKGKSFSVNELLGGDGERSAPFEAGTFATIYLSPKDYHRLHMPLTGTLKEMVHIPGRLFSVNAATTRNVPDLFARNERVAAIFDTEAGPMALVLVGAIFVSSIETVWQGVVTPPTANSVRAWRYQNNAPRLQKGDEMGRFNMGSTIIVLFGEDKAVWSDTLKPGCAVKFGQQIGNFKA